MLNLTDPEMRLLVMWCVGEIAQKGDQVDPLVISILDKLAAERKRRDDIRFSITCPRCGRTSYNPFDIAEGYCGNCHDWTRK